MHTCHASNNNPDEIATLQSIHGCYGAYAYFYRSDTSVYNVSLYAQAGAEVATPAISQSAYVLPPGRLLA